MPEFALEAAEDSTTRFTIVAAAPRPVRENIVTKGEDSGLTWSQGVTIMIAARAAT